MADNQGLRSNPFYTLHAMPWETDQKLLVRVQEMKLLYGVSPEEAERWKNALMHPGSRLTAEIGFLPDTSAAEIDELRAWLEQAELRCKGRGQTDSTAGTISDTLTDTLTGTPTGTPADTGISMPAPADFFAPRSSLAALNGAAAILQYWPVSTPERACAACLSLVSLLGQIHAETVQEEINRDRLTAGHQTEESLSTITYCLQKHREAILTDLADRCTEALAPQAFGRLRMLLAEKFSRRGSRFFRSQILDELVCRHLGHAGAAEADYCRTNAIRVMQEYKEAESGTAGDSGKKNEKQAAGSKEEKIVKPGVSGYGNKIIAARRKKQHAALLEYLRIWSSLTKPERMIADSKGYMDQAAEKLMEQANDHLVFMVNTCHDIYGGRTLLAAMEDLFFDMRPDARDLVRKNKKTLYVQG